MLEFNGIEATNEEIDCLMESIGGGKIVVEIGSFAGKTTLKLAEDNIVIAIDPFEKYLSGKKEDVANHLLEEARAIFKSRIKNKSIIWYEMSSEQALEELKNHGMFRFAVIDAIFIDGEHTRKALEKDICWMDLLNDKGIIAFHDYSEHWPEVKEFVDEFIKKGDLNVIAKKGSLIVLQLKEKY